MDLKFPRYSNSAFRYEQARNSIGKISILLNSIPTKFMPNNDTNQVTCYKTNTCSTSNMQYLFSKDALPNLLFTKKVPRLTNNFGLD